ncbi:MAG: CvpA family protein [Treponema sp.]|jgi:membrane protein required for colicin V production|nr:CvpA family protein [Treponema sp.]
MQNIAIIDLIFMVLIVIFVIRCALRGFIEEVLSMAAVVFGSLGAFLFYKNGAAFIRTQFPSLAAVQFIPELLAVMILFFSIYVLIKLLGRILKDIIERVKLGMVDRILGIIFGLIEGISLVSLVVFVLSLAQPIFFKDTPFLDRSIFAQRLLPMIHSGVIPLLKEVQE